MIIIRNVILFRYRIEFLQSRYKLFVKKNPNELKKSLIEILFTCHFLKFIWKLNDTNEILKYAFKIVMHIKCYDLCYKYNFLVIYKKKR